MENSEIFKTMKRQWNILEISFFSFQVEWKEKKVHGVEEDILLQRKQLELMENEMKRRENEVEEREQTILMEMAIMKETMAEKDAKIESLNSDLMEVCYLQ